MKNWSRETAPIGCTAGLNWAEEIVWTRLATYSIPASPYLIGTRLDITDQRWYPCAEVGALLEQSCKLKDDAESTSGLKCLLPCGFEQ